MGAGKVSLALVVTLTPSKVLPLSYPPLHLEGEVCTSEDLGTQVAQRTPPLHTATTSMSYSTQQAHTVMLGNGKAETKQHGTGVHPEVGRNVLPDVSG